MKRITPARLCVELQRMHDAVQVATEPRAIVRTEDLRLLFRLVADQDATIADQMNEVADFRKRINKKNAQLRVLKGNNP
jgi:hypothetical protein